MTLTLKDQSEIRINTTVISAYYAWDNPSQSSYNVYPYKLTILLKGYDGRIEAQYKEKAIRDRDLERLDALVLA